MKGLAQLCRIALGVAVLSLGPTAFGAFDEPGKLLFLDSYETLKTTNGSVTTHPASYAAGGNPIAGVIQGNAKLVEGKKGQSLELSGDSRVVYDHLSAINLFGGEASFWVKLNFDPNAKNQKTRTVLRNQVFLTFLAPNGNRCVLYTCLSDICFGAWDASGNLMLAKTARLPWKQGEWRQVALSWGKRARSVRGRTEEDQHALGRAVRAARGGARQAEAVRRALVFRRDRMRVHD